MRKFIVKWFALYWLFRFKLKPKNGKERYFSMSLLRIGPPTFLSLLGFAVCRVFEVFWLSWPFLAIFLILIWMGFDWFKVGYFQLFPIKWEELDDMQKYMFGLYEGYNNLTLAQRKEWTAIVKKYQL